ncbi:hypothetical protein A9P82_07365 [Arachidicoccus ginsenosidimutans]|uniref:bactofilin family protein n=1 Tax=Arachidicoccus sp. BS20 TaxID=1850526 RepID=UPI0007F11A3D|nr:polymer-forming cytoskeletal protein [Arachidicoccus sp. BS20]ANI89123.1 hypothetical protein A9P82_07365 [Arachidicoccus sp. BS20]
MQWLWINKKKNTDTKSNNFAAFILPEGSTIYGDIEALVPSNIEGVVEGNITSKATVIISGNALVKGDVICTDVLVYGKVCRNIYCNNKATVFNGGYVEGKIVAMITDLQENAVVKNTIFETDNSGKTDPLPDTTINAIVSLPKIIINERTWF